MARGSRVPEAMPEVGHMNRWSRRRFVAVAGTAAAGAPFVFTRRIGAARAVLSAQAIVDRIRQQVGVEWKPDTVDTFKAGDPAAPVTAIVTTALATIDVLAEAVRHGANLVITCEPTFYGRSDTPTPKGRGAGPAGAGRGGSAAGGANGRDQADPPPDPISAAKAVYIRKHGLVVWRFSDHWRLRRPDPFAQGLADAFGWSGQRAADDTSRVSIPPVTLRELAAGVKTTLGARGGIRVVGDPQITVERVGLLPGSTPLQASLRTLPDVDVIIAGEVREWETVEYARDTIAAGGRKGLVLTGRILSEEPGMKLCAQWLGSIVPELTTTWLRAGDPYWRPL